MNKKNIQLKEVDLINQFELTNGNNIYAPLVQALENATISPKIQLHIPGHTRGEGLFPDFKNLLEKKAVYLDTTDEFDNLGTLHPETGPIKEAQLLAAKAFGAAKSFFLLNGSTIGNLALALTLLKPNSKAIIGRNCHRSVVTGLILSGANPIWVKPKKLENWSIWGHICPYDIENLLEKNNDVSVVWITSPTYEGIVSDIQEISNICHKYGVPLLVDEAHGCLWNFNDKLPTSALHLGADAVVHSMHKTGGSFSQSSILHLSKNSLIDQEVLATNLRLLHTTSPSILLLTSIDAARAYLSSKEGKLLIDKAINHAQYIRDSLKDIKKVNILSASDNLTIDPTKIYLTIDGISGARIETILKVDYNIEIESTCDNGVLVLSNIGNSFDEIKYFCSCIKNIAYSNLADISAFEQTKFMPLLTPNIVMTPREAFYKEKKKVKKEEAIGAISAEIIAECPPGIFILTPGEIITEDHLPYLTKYNEISIINS